MAYYEDMPMSRDLQDEKMGIATDFSPSIG
jgi:hypothetical protein